MKVYYWIVSNYDVETKSGNYHGKEIQYCNGIGNI